jgi:5-methylcytosine-specific restriction enzyme A
MSGWANSTRRARLPRNWPALVAHVLERDPRCKLAYPGCTIQSTEVDHRQRGDDHRLSNLQGVCTPCHKRKTNRESQQARGVGASRRRPTEPHPGLRGGRVPPLGP